MHLYRNHGQQWDRMQPEEGSDIGHQKLNTLLDPSLRQEMVGCEHNRNGREP